MEKSVQISYFVHSTSVYNEKGIMAGWEDVDLSELGEQQSIKLRNLIKDRKFDAVFSADLKRTRKTAEVAFPDYKIIIDKRLRECNYGDMTATPSLESTDNPEVAINFVETPFPNGESYKDVEKRVRDFLKDLIRNYSGKNVAVVDSQASQLVLEVLLNGKTWEQAIRDDWRLKEPKEWKPGWGYLLKESLL